LIDVGDFVTHKNEYTTQITEVIAITHDYGGGDEVWVILGDGKRWDQECNFTLMQKKKPLQKHRIGVK